jgi:hypothetical protein
VRWRRGTGSSEMGQRGRRDSPWPLIAGADGGKGSLEFFET